MTDHPEQPPAWLLCWDYTAHDIHPRRDEAEAVMGNACGGCCSWMFPSEHGYDEDGKRSKTVLLDEENTWFEQDTVPLVSARYDNDDIGSDCVVTKTVVMRSPRATSPSTTSVTSKSVSSRAASTTSVSSGSSGGSSKLTKPPSRGLICIDKSDDETEMHVKSTRKESHERRHTDRSSFVESVGSYESANSQSSSSSLTASSNYVVVEQDAEAADDSHETSAHDDEQSSKPSSPKSPSKGSKTPGSPKKARYGRKNYRANSGRKKNE